MTWLSSRQFVQPSPRWVCVPASSIHDNDHHVQLLIYRLRKEASRTVSPKTSSPLCSPKPSSAPRSTPPRLRTLQWGMSYLPAAEQIWHVLHNSSLVSRTRECSQGSSAFHPPASHRLSSGATHCLSRILSDAQYPTEYAQSPMLIWTLCD